MIYALTVATALAATASTASASHAIRGSIVSHGASGSHDVRSAVVTDDHALKSKIAERVKGSRFSGGVQQLFEKAQKAKAAGKTSSKTASHSVTATAYDTGTAQELYYEGSDTSCSSPGLLYSYALGYCSAVDSETSYKLSCELDQGFYTLTTHVYDNGNCAGEEVFSDADSGYPSTCNSDSEAGIKFKYLCSSEKQPWSGYDTSKNGYWRESSYHTLDQCLNDYDTALAPETLVAYPNKCIGGLKTNTCSASGIVVNYYDDNMCKVFSASENFGLEACEENVDDDYGYTTVTYDYSVCTYYTSSEDDNVCFAADSLVTTEDGTSKRIADVERGDRIKTVANDGSTSFSEVAFVVHEPNTQGATFVNLRIATGESLKVTPEHLVPAGACSKQASLQAMPLVRASTVQVGDCLYTPAGQQKVVSASASKGSGIYSVVTTEMSGLIVVDGIVASSFGSSHSIANTYYHMHRMMYHVPGVSAMMGTRLAQRVNAIFGDVAVAVGRAFRII